MMARMPPGEMISIIWRAGIRPRHLDTVTQ